MTAPRMARLKRGSVKLIPVHYYSAKANAIGLGCTITLHSRSSTLCKNKPESLRQSVPLFLK
jgi:hypothetical protein